MKTKFTAFGKFPAFGAVYSWQNSLEEFGTGYKVVSIETESSPGRPFPAFTDVVVTLSYVDKQDRIRKFIRTPWNGTFKFAQLPEKLVHKAHRIAC